MSLVQMGKGSESVRFLDDVDLTFTMDNRRTSSDQVMNIDITAKPIVFRASYRDINLIAVIVNRAIALSSGATQSKPVESSDSKSLALRSTKTAGKTRMTGALNSDEARVVMTKEQVRCIQWIIDLS